MRRREFVTRVALLVAAIPFLGRAWVSEALAKEEPLPAGMKAVPETDPVASAIGYKADVKNIDYAKYPQRKKPDAKNQFCENCSLYTKSNASWGKCQMLTAGVVAAKGWCGSWSKKT